MNGEGYELAGSLRVLGLLLGDCPALMLRCASIIYFDTVSARSRLFFYHGIACIFLSLRAKDVVYIAYSYDNLEDHVMSLMRGENFFVVGLVFGGFDSFGYQFVKNLMEYVLGDVIDI